MSTTLFQLPGRQAGRQDGKGVGRQKGMAWSGMEGDGMGQGMQVHACCQAGRTARRGMEQDSRIEHAYGWQMR